MRKHRYDGKLMSIAELCALSPLDMSPQALRFRLNRGWPMNRALTQPFASRGESGGKGAAAANEPRARKAAINGVVANVAEMAKKAGISRQTASERIRRGWSPEEAVSVKPRSIRKPNHTSKP